MAPPLLQFDDVHVAAGGEEILRGVNVSLQEGELHALLGPERSGKSALARTLLGHPAYRVTHGCIRFKGEDVTAWPTDVRARAGIFLAFQRPEEIPGVPVTQFLRQAVTARKGVDLSVLELRVSIGEWLKRLDLDASLGERFLNEGLSGGEKNRNEILQMAILEPDLAILDETDSGLDIDALGVVASGIAEVRRSRPELGVLLVTHYQRILDRITPDVVHLLVDGRVATSGGPDLARKLEAEGYEAWRST